jgi:hypothetical protein
MATWTCTSPSRQNDTPQFSTNVTFMLTRYSEILPSLQDTLMS